MRVAASEPITATPGIAPSWRDAPTVADATPVCSGGHRGDRRVRERRVDQSPAQADGELGGAELDRSGRGRDAGERGECGGDADGPGEQDRPGAEAAQEPA